jgi:hypothetical protein
VSSYPRGFIFKPLGNRYFLTSWPGKRNYLNQNVFA